MISSMTGFCNITQENEFGKLVVEIKTLNSRYFELQIKLSDDLRIFEPEIRKKILKIVHRGKIECRVYLKINENNTNFNNIDLKHAKKIISSLEKVSSLIKVSLPINPIEIANLAGKDKKLNSNIVGKVIMKPINKALDKLLVDRQREGKK